MATATGKARCVTCGKEKAIMRCEGCVQSFCYNHMTDHRTELSQQLNEVEVIRDLVCQTTIEQTAESRKHLLMRQVDEWEHGSIIKIRETAEKARQLLLRHTTGHITEIEVKLNKLTNQLRESRQENDFFERDLHQWKEELAQLREKLIKPLNITVRHDSTPLVNKIYIDAAALSRMPIIGTNAKWTQNGVTVVGGNGQGKGVNQLYYPASLYIDDDQTIYMADCSNHRIVEWKNGAISGQIVAGGNGSGNRNDQLSGPRDVAVDTKSNSLIICDYDSRRVVRQSRRNSTTGEVIISNVICYGLAMDNDGYIYVSDVCKHEVRRWKIGDTDGTVVAGGNGRGNRLDQLNAPYYIFVDQNHSVYVSDYYNHHVMKWMEGAKEGTVVAGGQGQGNSLTQLSCPFGVVVDQLGTVYVSDHNNHRVMRWCKRATQGTVVVGANQLRTPVGLSFDQQGNLYVVEYSNHRVQKFNIDSSSNS